MAGATSPPKIAAERPTQDLTSALILETVALQDAVKIVSGRLDEMTTKVTPQANPQGNPQGNGGARADDNGTGDLGSKMDQLIALMTKLVGSRGDSNGGNGNGASDAATGEEAVSSSSETNEEEKGHATEEPGGGGATFDTTRARRLASDSARADSAAARRAADAEDDARCGEAQHRFDEVLSLHGRRADRPRVAERSGVYRRRVLKQLAGLSAKHHGLDPHQIHDERALDEIEGSILEGVRQAAYDPQTVQPGTLREVRKRDQAGRERIEFIGPKVGYLQAGFGAFMAPSYRAKINRPPGNVYNN
jgi:hypothetical protein